MPTSAPPRKAKLVEMPYALFAQLCEAAAESGRSVNAEIVWRLRESFRSGGGYRTLP